MLSVDVTPPTEVGEQLLDVPLGEGGAVAADGLCSAAPHGRTPVAIVGGTGYVGRLLARRLLSHPTFCLGPIVGSKRSEGMVFQDVWEQKEAALMANYGSQLWSAMTFPPELAGVRVSSLDELLAGPCMLAISCVAPDVGYVEDLMVTNGMKVFSISPYKRMDNLLVPEVNPEQLRRNAELSLFKSPNCVSVGTSLPLKALADAFGLVEASVCTFQSLSGRGDAMYPSDLVCGNVYPVYGTKEHTEEWIHNELSALLALRRGTLSVRAHRVGVHIGHFVDVRVKVANRAAVGGVDGVYRVLERFAPLASLAGRLPSLPPRPIAVTRDVGAPRPASHHSAHGGMQVTVGNVKVSDGVWDICFSVVVNNMVRGAYGAALLMAEYHQHLAALRPPAPSPAAPPSPVGPHPQSPLGERLPAPPRRSGAGLSEEKLRASCAADRGGYHAEVARKALHWWSPEQKRWLSWDCLLYTSPSPRD